MPRTTTVGALSLRALNRATLARQMLLERCETTPLDAVGRLAGMQAQVASPPFIGLWSRLARFSADELVTLAAARELVRGTLMRGTLHLVSAGDFAAFRPVLGPMLARLFQGYIGERAAGHDIEAIVAAARELFTAAPRTFDVMRKELAARFPEADDRMLGYAARVFLPVVQVPDGSRWAWAAKAPFTVADPFLGRPIAATPDDLDAATRDLVRRYLAAFGPASVQDAQAWSGLAGLRPTFESLRAELVAFRDERGRELFDLPDAPRPPEDAPAPVRLVADYDNLILSHDDRARVVPPAFRPLLLTKNGIVPGTVLVDGFVAGTWSWRRAKATAELMLVPFWKWPRATRRDLEAEAAALLDFVAPELGHEVRIERVVAG